MPQIDLPLDKLKRYKGTNPQPRDFDAFWRRAVEELDSLPPDVQLESADFSCTAAECYHLYFTGVRRARIHAKYLKPKQAATPHPAVLIFHGYTGNTGDWFDKVPFAAEGFSVFALDCRGQGGLSEDTGGMKGTTHHGHIIRGLNDAPDAMLFRHIYLDTLRLARIAMARDEVDPGRVGALGGSQGGGLTLACAALEPRIKRAAPTYPFLCDFKRVWDLDLGRSAYDELRSFFRRFDPRHEREDEIFTRLGYIDVQHLASRIKADVLMATGLMDEVCPPSTQFAAYNKIRTKKSVRIYPDFGHEPLPGFSDDVFQFMLEL